MGHRVGTRELIGILRLLGLDKRDATEVARAVVRLGGTHPWLAQDCDGWWKLFTYKPVFAPDVHTTPTLRGLNVKPRGVWVLGSPRPQLNSSGYRKLAFMSPNILPDNDTLTFDTSQWRGNG